jgi:hypothetical protein
MSIERINSKCLIIFIALILLAFITWWVTSTIKENHLQDDPMLYKLKEMMLPLHPDVRDLKLYKGKKSYTINKDKIYLCLTDDNDDYYPENMLLYVLIHEYAHFLNKEDIGHTPKFHAIFEELLDKATELGIYNPSIPPIQNYCGHN